MPEARRPLHRCLQILAPLALDEAVGYHLASRYYGLHWLPGDAGLYLTDGLRGYTTPGWGFLVFAHNHQVIPHLQAFDFGSDDRGPKHMLVIDTQSRETFAMHLAEARRFLLAQHKQLDPQSLAAGRTELRDAIKANWGASLPDKTAVLEALEQAEVCYPLLEQELDAGLRFLFSLS